MPILAGMEIFTGFSCVYAGYELLTSAALGSAQWSMVFSAFTLLALFFGQRLAKDYAGAASLTGYFSAVVLGTIIFYIGPI